MNQLFVRSLLVVTLLFGLLFAVGAGVLYYYHFPVVWAVIFAVAVVLLQYLASPFFIDRIFRIKWIQPEELTPEFGEFFRKYCEECNLKQPKFGIIEDLFGIFRAGKLIDKKGTFRGWYRRGPIPYFELKEAEFEDGGRIKCHYSTFIWCIAALCTSIGIFTTLA